MGSLRGSVAVFGGMGRSIGRSLDRIPYRRCLNEFVGYYHYSHYHYCRDCCGCDNDQKPKTGQRLLRQLSAMQ